MANLFNSGVHKQQYDEGVMKELRDSIPLNSVSKVRTDNVEYIFDRYGADESAENTTDGNYTVVDAAYSTDSKLIDKEAVKSHRIRYKEIARQGFDIAVDLADRHGFAMAEAVHRNSANVAYQRALGILDNEVLTGSPSALTPIVLSNTNPDAVSAALVQVLQERNAYAEGTPFVMMTPKQAKQFNLYSMQHGFEVADNSLRNGLFQVNRGHLFGLDAIVTNEIPRSRIFTSSGNQVANDNMVLAITDKEGGLATVTWTWKAAVAVAGDVLIGASAAASMANMATAIMAASGQGVTTGAGTIYIAQSNANNVAVKNAGILAVSDTTTLTVTSFRYTTMTKTSATLAAGTYTENILSGIRNAVEIVMPSNGYNSDEKLVPGFNGKELTITQVHDAHIFQKNRNKVVRLLVNA
jgi:hypothetical protein